MVVSRVLTPGYVERGSDGKATTRCAAAAASLEPAPRTCSGGVRRSAAAEVKPSRSAKIHRSRPMSVKPEVVLTTEIEAEQVNLRQPLVGTSVQGFHSLSSAGGVSAETCCLQSSNSPCRAQK